MGFQAAVKTDPAIGIPGQEVNPRQAVYTAFNYVSDGTVPAGGFAFAVALNGTSQTEQNVLSAKAEAGAKPVGFVERDVIATIPAPTDDATQVYPKGTCPRSPFAASSTPSRRARLRRASRSSATRRRARSPMARLVRRMTPAGRSSSPRRQDDRRGRHGDLSELRRGQGRLTWRDK